MDIETDACTHGPALLVPRSLMPELGAALDGAIQIVVAEDWAAASAALLATPDSAHPAPALALPAVEPLALVTTEDEGLADAIAMAHRLGTPVIAAGEDNADVLPAVVAGLTRALTQARRDSATLGGDAALLRREHETLQRRFRDLEAFFYVLGAPKFSLAMEAAPTEACIALTGSAMSVLRQWTPVDARGLVAVDLHVLGAMGEGTLTVALEDMAGAVLAECSRPLQGLGLGWQRIAFEHGLDATSREATIALRFSGQGEIRLALAAEAISPCHHPVADGTETLLETLAFRLWRGLPGASARAEGNGPRILRRASDLPPPVLRRCDWRRPFQRVVRYWRKENAVFVRAPRRGLTVAVIEAIPVHRTASVTAFVQNARAGGPVIGFAIAVVPAGEGGALARSFKPAQWTRMAPLQWGEVHACPAHPICDAVDLVLATTILEGRYTDRAWPLFRGFEFDAWR